MDQVLVEFGNNHYELHLNISKKRKKKKINLNESYIKTFKKEIYCMIMSLNEHLINFGFQYFCKICKHQN